MKADLGELLNNNKIVKLIELVLLFVLAFGFIKLFTPLAGDDVVSKQVVIWFANLFMLLYVWLGLKLRGQKLSYFGITFGKISRKEIIRVILTSFLVFICAVAAFVLGSIIMANIIGIPEGSDMSNYEFLRNNIGMLLVTLFGTYIVASFGEEVIYRGFIMNRLMELGLTSRVGKMLVILISAIIFGLVHYQWGPMGMVQTAFMGAVLAFFYIKLKKRIWILVLAHAYMDTLLLLQMYFAAN